MEAVWKVTGVGSKDHNYYQPKKKASFVFIVLGAGWGQGWGGHTL